MRIIIANTKGQILVTTSPPECIACARDCPIGTRVVSCSYDGSKRRAGKQADENGEVYLCMNDEDFVMSKRLFNSLLDVVSSLTPAFVDLRSQLEVDARLQATRLIHNLKTLNAHGMQDVYALVPQEWLSSRIYSDQLDVLEEIVVQDPRKAAATILRLNKYNIAMKCEFGSFSKLHESGALLSTKLHPIRRVVLNTLYTFFPDFTDKQVHVDIEQNMDHIKLDYESFQVALFHIVDNAAKYVAPGSIVKVLFVRRGDQYLIMFDMVSLEISDLDYERMFDDGYSSDVARAKGWAGNGVGMGVVRALLKLNKGTVQVFRNTDPSAARTISGIRYERNRFELALPAKLL